MALLQKVHNKSLEWQLGAVLGAPWGPPRALGMAREGSEEPYRGHFRQAWAMSGQSRGQLATRGRAGRREIEDSEDSAESVNGARVTNGATPGSPHSHRNANRIS
eukprot:452138-Pyramimonas_sp.AAC.1